MNLLSPVLLVIITFSTIIESVDKSNFKTCEQSGFCKRNRNLEQRPDRFQLVDGTIAAASDHIAFQLKNVDTGIIYQAQLQSLLAGQTFRFRVDEIDSPKKRFDPSQLVLMANIKGSKINIVDQFSNGFTVEAVDQPKNKVVVQMNPFRLDVYSMGELVMVVNQRGLFNFEHFRHKPQASETDPNTDCNENCWEETFKGSTDSKPNGPMSIGMDVTLIGFEHVYGIPEHADSFALKDTKGNSDPYRLFNSDVFEYELYSPMTLYGAYPLMIAHSSAPKTVGLFWLNPSETWIDIESSNTGIGGLLTNLVSDSKPNKLTHWISETGLIDMFFLLGPNAANVMHQNAQLFGTTRLPPIYSIGYHQCRWNYFSDQEVMDVDEKADIYDIPMDAIWLDIEYTDGRSKKYFTHDPVMFKNWQSMIQNLTAKGRRLITIIDPHLKRESGYPIYDEASSQGLLTKDAKEDKDFEGWCWPGSSVWPDYLNPTVRDWWADKFDPKLFPGFEGGIVDYWNDMNEPSVFSGPEITAPRDMRHMDNVEHREIHNIYGYLMTKSTYDGLLKHRPNLRPFILSRSFFAGSQRNVAVWTGDNMSKWEHLKITIPMLLSHSIVGITFIGADIGGFFFNPESEEMMIRWYQASIFHPFYRAHAHLDTKRREPWLFSDFTRQSIRQSIRIRYSYLPYMYQLFYENEQTGMPPFRPLWMQFPTDSKTLSIDTSHMLGSNLLFAPVLDKEAKQLDIYLPSEQHEQTFWLDVFAHHVYQGGQEYRFEVDINSIPIFQRSGTIIPKRERPRRSAVLAVNDPISLQIFLNSNGSASGFIYLDDGQTFDYQRRNAFISGRFNYSKRTLTYTFDKGDPDSNRAWLERVTIVGYPSKPNRIQIIAAEELSSQLAFKYDQQKHLLVIRKPAVMFGQNWQIKIN
ncbi:glucosidase 2 subunit alpha isoform X2 [Dermatophagoides farinae]|uniref:glucosidase 2 subunit alpha isoform X2 n=1 Tax=Dermatophagoides farinae TaxID=6954 RepID=UPI003F608D3A